jgi:hypothetical protein
MKVLQFQNKKLVERIDQRKRAEEELHKRIEQLENRQRTDDAVLMIVNRYWNQVCQIVVKHFICEKCSYKLTMNMHSFSFMLYFSHL